jgi:hypothetical protein
MEMPPHSPMYRPQITVADLPLPCRFLQGSLHQSIGYSLHKFVKKKSLVGGLNYTTNFPTREMPWNEMIKMTTYSSWVFEDNLYCSIITEVLPKTIGSKYQKQVIRLELANLN